MELIDKEMYEKYPCFYRAEDGACAACAYMRDCGWPEDCKVRKETAERQPTLTPPNEWVSVEERLPDSQADVLVVAFWHETWQTMIGWHSDTSKKWRVITPHGEMEPGGVTHWMPLPESPDRRPPEGEEDT